MIKKFCDATGQEIDGPFLQTNVDSRAITIQDPDNGRHKFLNEQAQMVFRDLPTYVDYLYEQYEKAPWILNRKHRPQHEDNGLVITLDK